jgi:uncharacterized protein
MATSKVNWIRVLIYVVIATTISSAFRFQLFDWYKELALPYGLTGIKYLLEGVGPLIGAILMYLLFKKKSCITAFGSSIKKSLIMVSVPIILFSIFGAQNDQNLNTHYYGFIIGITIMLYGIFEEFGWRGYLQDELKDVKPFSKYLIIGILWYAWHLTFISQETTLLNELKFLGILIFASWGIGQIAEKTNSVFTSACFHIIGNILSFSPLLSTAFNNNTRYLIFGISVIIWIFVVNTWRKPTLRSHTHLQAAQNNSQT